MLRFFCTVVLVLGLIGCAHKSGSGGLNHRALADGTQPPLPDLYRTPTGEYIVPGTVDKQGYVLPLDVIRPKSPRPGRPQPVLKQIEHGSDTFSETRLGPDDGHTHNETAIAASGDTIIAGWNQATDTGFQMGVARSIDGGSSWNSETLAGFTQMSDPVVAAGGDGRWYYAYIASGGALGSDYEVYVVTSTDDGLTWGAPVAVTNNNNFDDKPYMAASGHDVLVVWADFSFSPARIRAAVSANGGASFTHSTVLIQNSGGGNGACPVIGPDGNYYVFWRDSMQQFMWMAKSEDGGQSWSPDVQISSMSPLLSTLPPGFRIVNLPSAAASPTTGELMVIWNDASTGNGDIVAVHSSDGGATWTSKTKINDDPGSTQQFFPWLAVDGTGKFHAVWYDMRENGSKIDVYYAHTESDKLTFSTNQRVTSQSFTPILPWEAGLANFIGDYNGIAASETTVFPCYQDSRRGLQEVYVATIPQQPTLTYEELLAQWSDGVTVLDILQALPVR